MNAVRIAWFSPFSNKYSNAAIFSRRVLPKLVESYEVELFLSLADLRQFEQSNNLGNYQAFAEGRFFLRDRTNPFDLVIYQLEDTIAGSYIWRISPSLPGISILHDAYFEFLETEALSLMIDRFLLKQEITPNKLQQIAELADWRERGWSLQPFVQGNEHSTALLNAQRTVLSHKIFAHALAQDIHTTKLDSTLPVIYDGNTFNYSASANPLILTKTARLDEVLFALEVCSELDRKVSWFIAESAERKAILRAISQFSSSLIEKIDFISEYPKELSALLCVIGNSMHGAPVVAYDACSAQIPVIVVGGKFEEISPTSIWIDESSSTRISSVIVDSIKMIFNAGYNAKPSANNVDQVVSYLGQVINAMKAEHAVALNEYRQAQSASRSLLVEKIYTNDVFDQQNLLNQVTKDLSWI